MIEVSHLSRQFGNFRAVDDVSFSIPTGQIVGLLGPNGAGKTTTMRMICGFLGATSGSVKIDGKDISENPVEAKSKIGYMPESAPLYSDMIVEDYLNYVAQMQGVDEAEKVPALCATCGLKEVMHKNISELSRGYRQRVGLAHALMNDPEILVLDEPTSGLDPNQIEDVRALIKEIGKTRTVIISTHILGEVETLCPRVIIISKGKLVADSPTNELRERVGNASALNLVFGGASFTEAQKALAKIDGVCGVEKAAETEKIKGERKLCGLRVLLKEGVEARKEIFSAAVANKWTIYHMEIQKNSLEDVFHTLTQGKDEK
ncbi:MAG: ATP-binding cassette domain-containing protein [Treponema sp.]|nr:ATP-binding cassette domain-containing protein [Treponema sp.]